MDNEASSWVDRELAGSRFADERLGKRLRKLVTQLDSGIGETIPFACADWANTKAAYRFLSNDGVSEGEILAGHFAATSDRIKATTGPILILQDTTEFVYNRIQPARIGSISYAVYRAKQKPYTVCGLLMHESLAITPEGLPLGLTAVKFWSRSKFKGANELKRHVNPTRVPIEQKESIRWLENMVQSTALVDDPGRCVHIGDRENDIYEFFCRATEIGTHFLIRTCVDRLAGNGDHTINAEMSEIAVRGCHRIELRTKTGEFDQARIDIRYKTINVLPPIGKQKRYPALQLTVIHAREASTPLGREAIDWRLITNLPIANAEDAIEKLHWYSLRWKIEVFHKILKSGCRAEEARLRTAERLVNLIAIFCLLSWRIFWMTMINRVAPTAPPSLALTAEECIVLDQAVPDRDGVGTQPTLARYLVKLARLGGYLARSHDPPPGNIVMWRGWRRLTDIMIGYDLTPDTYG